MRKLILVALTLTAIAAGAPLYPGAALYYLLFSAVFFAVLFSAFYLPFQYSHFFVALIWFLAFWLKLVLHFVFGHFGFAEAAAYVEPAGGFDGTGTSWDQVLLTASVGATGYLAGRLATVPFLRRRPHAPSASVAPCWYPRLKTALWLLVGVSLAAILLANAEMGLVVRGFVPSVKLPWPLGGLFAWTTDIGLALIIAVLTAWDRSTGAGIVRGSVALCIEGAAISIATSSRGIYLFHTLPVLVSEGRRRSMSLPAFRRAAPLLAIWLIGAVTIPLLTTGLRGVGEGAFFAKVESGHPPTSATLERPSQSASPAATPQRSASGQVVPTNILPTFFTAAMKGGSRLIVDRWVGLEGLMSAVTYPDLGLALFKEAALQRRTYGMVDVYTGKISRSNFTEDDAQKFHNATLAGPIAFLYFSGSLAVVFGGMVLISVLMSVLEAIWRALFCDPLVIAMSGFYLALVVMQLSTGLIQAITGPSAVTILLLFVWLVARMGARLRPAQLEQIHVR